jgi:hypothetical protein
MLSRCMSEQPASKPRIYADFNSCRGDERGMCLLAPTV